MRTEISIPVEKGQSIKAVLNFKTALPPEVVNHTLIVMAHDFPGGMDGRENLLSFLEDTLVAKDYHTLRFGFRGAEAGPDDPAQFTLASAQKDFKAVLSWAFEGGYGKFIYIGEGIGAAVSILCTDLDVKAMALFWPPLDLQAYRAVITKQGQMLEDGRSWSWRGTKIGAAFMQELGIKKIYNDLLDVFMPTLIFQGARDEIVSAQNIPLAKKWMSPKRLECTIFHEGRNGLAGEKERAEIAAGLLAFLNKNA